MLTRNSVVNIVTMSDTFILSGREFRDPVDKTTLGQFFFTNAEKYGDRICQIDGTANISETFASVKKRSTRLAMSMRQRGIATNDVVSICSPNTLDNTIPILSAFYLGAKVVNFDGSLSVGHTKHLLGLVRPKMMFVDETLVEKTEESLEGLGLFPEIVVFGHAENYGSFSDLVQEQENEEAFRPVEGDPDDVAVMFFSSGTTGLPKAICHSHYSFLLMTQSVRETGIEAKVSFHFSSFYWITAMIMLTTCFKTGNCRAFCRNPSAEDVFRIIETYKVEYLIAAPILTYIFTNYQNSKDYDTSSLKLLRCVGTPMAANQIQKLKDIFVNCFIVIIYALTEGGLLTSFDFETDRKVAEKKLALGSCGKVAPELQLKVSDLDSGTTLGPHQKGEIRTKSQSTMKGYCQGDSSQVFDDDDFLKTGDVGYYDEDGYIYLIGRVKEMFKYQSWHIVPALIETALLELPAIKEVAVVGVPCGADGEAPAAAVVLNVGFSLSEEDIDGFLKHKVADRERMRGGVIFVDKLSKTATGKVARQHIKNMFAKN